MKVGFAELIEKFESEIEYAYLFRLDEFTKFENCINLTDDNEDNLKIYRKMLVVMMYSYFEGFCKNLLMIYANYIRGLTRKLCKYQHSTNDKTMRYR